MRQVKRERHEAAERQARNDGATDAASVEHRRHVVDGRLVRIERRIVGRIGAVVPAHVPRDHVIAVRQRVHLTLPHARAGAVSVREQHGRSRAVLFVVDAYAVAIEI